MALHLDPKRDRAGYEGTGYLGVYEDSWPSGWKHHKPFGVKYEGKGCGRFPTVLLAAAHYARLVAGTES